MDRQMASWSLSCKYISVFDGGQPIELILSRSLVLHNYGRVAYVSISPRHPIPSLTANRSCFDDFDDGNWCLVQQVARIA